MKKISFNIRTSIHISKTEDRCSYMSMSGLNEKDESVTQYWIELYHIEVGWYGYISKYNIIKDNKRGMCKKHNIIK